MAFPWNLVIQAAVGSANTIWGGQKETKLKWPDAYHTAIDMLDKLAQAKETISTRDIAGLSKEELAAQQRAIDFSKSGTDPALLQAITAAGQISGGTNIYDNPEFRGMMEKITSEGRLDTQSMARSLQLGSSGAVGSTDRDVLGRSITGMQERLMAAGSSYLSAERARQLQATGLLGQLAGQREGSQVTKLGIGSGVTGLQRQIQQMINDARIEQEQRDIQFRYGTQADLFSRILGSQVGRLEGGGPNDFSKFFQGWQAAGQQMSPSFGGMGGASQAGGQGSTANISGSSFTNPQAVFGAPASMS